MATKALAERRICRICRRTKPLDTQGDPLDDLLPQDMCMCPDRKSLREREVYWHDALARPG